jgi:hypothetical protein
MNIIYSAWKANKKRISCQYKLAALSNFLSKKHGFKTFLYTSRESLNEMYKIAFDNIKVFDCSVLNDLPKSIWSCSKILSVADQVEPFLHLDLDFLIYKRNYELIPEIKNKKFIFYHYEHINAETPVKLLNYLFDNTDYSLGIDPASIKNIYPRNFGMFGSYCPFQIQYMSSAAKKLIDYLKKHKDFYDSGKPSRFVKDNNLGGQDTVTVVIEQLVFSLLMTENLKDYEFGSYSDIVRDYSGEWDCRNNMYHIHGNKEIFLGKIDEILAAYGIRY